MISKLNHKLNCYSTKRGQLLEVKVNDSDNQLLLYKSCGEVKNASCRNWANWFSSASTLQWQYINGCMCPVCVRRVNPIRICGHLYNSTFIRSFFLDPMNHRKYCCRFWDQSLLWLVRVCAFKPHTKLYNFGSTPLVPSQRKIAVGNFY